jgi:hypothetical protein
MKHEFWRASWNEEVLDVQGFIHENCQHPICFGFASNVTKVCSGNGNCTSPNNCNDGFIHENCQHPICFGFASNETKVCSGNGNCTSPNK